MTALETRANAPNRRASEEVVFHSLNPHLSLLIQKLGIQCQQSRTIVCFKQITYGKLVAKLDFGYSKLILRKGVKLFKSIVSHHPSGFRMRHGSAPSLLGIEKSETMTTLTKKILIKLHRDYLRSNWFSFFYWLMNLLFLIYDFLTANRQRDTFSYVTNVIIVAGVTRNKFGPSPLQKPRHDSNLKWFGRERERRRRRKTSLLLFDVFSLLMFFANFLFLFFSKIYFFFMFIFLLH